MRRARIHRRGAIYYLVLSGNNSRPIFRGNLDHQQFAAIVERATRRFRVRIHAFCWTPTEARFAVQVGDTPVGKWVQRVCAAYARFLNLSEKTSGYVFQQRYSAVLLSTPALLPDVVRHIHTTPKRLQIAESLRDFEWSSHRAYLGLDRIPWLTTRPLLGTLAVGRKNSRLAYRLFLSSTRLYPDAPQRHGFAFYDRSPAESRFAHWLSQQRTPGALTVSVDDIMLAASRRLGIPLSLITSPSRKRYLAMARALVAWKAVANGIATYAEVGRQLNRDPSTLYVAAMHYKCTRPQLFKESLPTFLQKARKVRTTVLPIERPAKRVNIARRFTG